MKKLQRETIPFFKMEIDVIFEFFDPSHLSDNVRDAIKQLIDETENTDRKIMDKLL